MRTRCKKHKHWCKLVFRVVQLLCIILHGVWKKWCWLVIMLLYLLCHHCVFNDFFWCLCVCMLLFFSFFCCCCFFLDMDHWSDANKWMNEKASDPIKTGERQKAPLSVAQTYGVRSQKRSQAIRITHTRMYIRYTTQLFIHFMTKCKLLKFSTNITKKSK